MGNNTETPSNALVKKNKKPVLLFLCHRPPYPANKGDKIRSFNILKQLSGHFEIHLAAPTENPLEVSTASNLHKWCSSAEIFYIPKWKRAVQALFCLLTGKPLTNGWFYSSKITTWVSKKININNPSSIFVFCSSMAQYVIDTDLPNLNKVIDFVDMDSAKWHQFHKKSSGFKRWIFLREYRLLSEYEKEICSKFSKSFFVSESEVQLFSPDNSVKDKVDFFPNGVDLQYYKNLSTPCENNNYSIVFTGAMNYLPNIDAVTWFVSNCWHDIKKSVPKARLFIVGSNPSSEITCLKSSDIIVTSEVPDIRPYLANATMAIAPMRIGGGIKNKVLEAIAMAKPIVMSPLATEGLNLPQDPALIIATSPNETVEACIKLLKNPVPADHLRLWASENACWHEAIKPLLNALRVYSKNC